MAHLKRHDGKANLWIPICEASSQTKLWMVKFNKYAAMSAVVCSHQDYRSQKTQMAVRCHQGFLIWGSNCAEASCFGKEM